MLQNDKWCGNRERAVILCFQEIFFKLMINTVKYLKETILKLVALLKLQLLDVMYSS